MPWVIEPSKYYGEKYANVIIYSGLDKHDNTEIIKEYVLPNDVWFHADKNEHSAHVYLRIPGLKKLQDIPPELLNLTLIYFRRLHIKDRFDHKVINIMYTFAKNVKPTEEDGKVIVDLKAETLRTSGLHPKSYGINNETLVVMFNKSHMKTL